MHAAWRNFARCEHAIGAGRATWRPDVSGMRVSVLVTQLALAAGPVDGADAGPPQPAFTIRDGGNPSREAIRQVVRGHSADLRRCYEGELVRAHRARTGAPTGRMVARWSIGKEGAVTSVDVLSALPGASTAFTTCVRESILGWRFPKVGPSGEAVVLYPFIFRTTPSALEVAAASVDVADAGSPPPTFTLLDGGTFGGDSIRQVVQEHAAELRLCYRAEMARVRRADAGPAPTGQMVAQWSISPEGEVTSAEVVSALAGASAAFTRCVRDFILDWRFAEAPYPGAAVVTYPFVFRPTPEAGQP